MGRKGTSRVSVVIARMVWNRLKLIFQSCNAKDFQPPSAPLQHPFFLFLISVSTPVLLLSARAVAYFLPQYALLPVHFFASHLEVKRPEVERRECRNKEGEQLRNPEFHGKGNMVPRGCQQKQTGKMSWCKKCVGIRVWEFASKETLLNVRAHVWYDRGSWAPLCWQGV